MLFSCERIGRSDGNTIGPIVVFSIPHTYPLCAERVRLSHHHGDLAVKNLAVRWEPSKWEIDGDISLANESNSNIYEPIFFEGEEEEGKIY